MDDCVAAVSAAVAAYRRRKQRIKYISQLTLVLGLLYEEDTTLYSSYVLGGTAVTSSVHITALLYAVGGRLHSTVCMASCGLQAAFE